MYYVRAVFIFYFIKFAEASYHRLYVLFPFVLLMLLLLLLLFLLLVSLLCNFVSVRRYRNNSCSVALCTCSRSCESKRQSRSSGTRTPSILFHLTNLLMSMSHWNVNKWLFWWDVSKKNCGRSADSSEFKKLLFTTAAIVLLGAEGVGNKCV